MCVSCVAEAPQFDDEWHQRTRQFAPHQDHHAVNYGQQHSRHQPLDSHHHQWVLERAISVSRNNYRHWRHGNTPQCVVGDCTEMMEVATATRAVKHAKLQSNHHHQQTNTQVFTGQMPFLSPSQLCQSTEGKGVTQRTCSSQVHLVSSNLFFDSQRLLVTFEETCILSALWC